MQAETLQNDEINYIDPWKLLPAAKVLRRPENGLVRTEISILQKRTGFPDCVLET